jgi:threonine dehydratase
MPASSAKVKIEAVQEFGGQVDLIDTNQVSRAARVRELLARYPEAYGASAYDDPLVIAGNATLGAELAALNKPFDCVLAPLGGGGLTGGLVQGLRGAGSIIPVFAVEPVLANDGARSFRSGTLLANEAEPATIADGVRTLSLGRHNWEILRKGLADVIEVTEGQIKEAVRLLFHLANLKVEPTGALPVAGLLAQPERFKGLSVCLVASGGNVDPELFRSLIE